MPSCLGAMRFLLDLRPLVSLRLLTSDLRFLVGCAALRLQTSDLRPLVSLRPLVLPTTLNLELSNVVRSSILGADSFTATWPSEKVGTASAQSTTIAPEKQTNHNGLIFLSCFHILGPVLAIPQTSCKLKDKDFITGISAKETGGACSEEMP